MKTTFEESNRLQAAHASFNNNEVDRVIVLMTTETAGEVRAAVDGGVVIGAFWTSEGEPSTPVLCRKETGKKGSGLKKRRRESFGTQSDYT